MSLEGFEYILTIVDVFTGFVVLGALKSKTMEDLARVLWDVICDKGPMKIIQCDNGKEFVNKVITALVQLFGVERRLITPYHPQANGLVERNNREVENQLRKYLVGAMEFWHEWLPCIQLALNVRYLDRIGATPFDLMYGRAFIGFDDFSNALDFVDLKSAVA